MINIVQAHKKVRERGTPYRKEDSLIKGENYETAQGEVLSSASVHSQAMNLHDLLLSQPII